MDTLELFALILKIAKGCPSLPNTVTDKLTKGKIPRTADYVQECRIRKDALHQFKNALAGIKPDTLDGADQMWRERMLQALQFI